MATAQSEEARVRCRLLELNPRTILIRFRLGSLGWLPQLVYRRFEKFANEEAPAGRSDRSDEMHAVCTRYANALAIRRRTPYRKTMIMMQAQLGEGLSISPVLAALTGG